MRRHHQTLVRGQATATQGFSLIELLIVVAIILILAAIAIPNMLRARMSANEASAANSVRLISRAEVAYYYAYPTKGFADSLDDLSGPALNCTPSVTSACLVDSSLTAASKSGYTFAAKGIATGGSNTEYVVGAVPVSFDRTGTKDYCSSSDGALRWQTGATGDAPVSTLAECAVFAPVQ
jgi:type IV pilus assembly protein PilA